jgi:hypothetical protein
MGGSRYPGYDVLAKRHTPSWNEQTRRVIDRRLAVPRDPRFFTEAEFAVLAAVCDRILPQPSGRPPIPVAALIDDKMHENAGDGFRNAKMPPMGEAWRRGLRALEGEARRAHGVGFPRLDAAEKDALLRRLEKGEIDSPALGGMPGPMFFKERLLRDVTHAYYAHPTAWNEIGWGGPASPRGYVRMGPNRRDPWEAAEAKGGGDEEAVRRENRRVG